MSCGTKNIFIISKVNFIMLKKITTLNNKLTSIDDHLDILDHDLLRDLYNRKQDSRMCD